MYQTFLIEHTLVFQFVLASLLRPAITIDVFAAKHYISRSTVNRTLKTPKTYLKSREIQLNTSQMTLNGNEIDIRLFLLQVFLMIDPERIDYLFKEYRKESGVLMNLNKDNLSVTHRHVLMVIFITARLRFIQGYGIEEVSGFETFYPPLDEELEAYLHSLIHDQEQFTFHKHYLKSMIFFMVNYTDRSTAIDHVIDTFSQNIKKSQPLFERLTNDIFDALLSQFSVQNVDARTSHQMKKIVFLIVYLTYASNRRHLNFWTLKDRDRLRQQKPFSDLEEEMKSIIYKYAVV